MVGQRALNDILRCSKVRDADVETVNFYLLVFLLIFVTFQVIFLVEKADFCQFATFKQIVNP